MSAITTTDNISSNTMTATADPNISSHHEQDFLVKSNLAPATLEALKTLSRISSNKGIDDFSNCEKLTASLEQMRARRNINLFEKLDAIKQDFSGLNHKIAKMEESIIDLKETTSNLVKSLPQSDLQRKR